MILTDRKSILLACALLFCAVPAAAEENSIETVVVTASALPGTSLDPKDLPLSTEVLGSDTIASHGAPSLLSALARNAGGVSLSDAQDNPFQPNLYYHGFQASPLAGDAQGLAVYVDGVRFNQSFGDAVAWDLVPDIAVRSMAVEGSNPVFGLNALGGSIAIAMKDGFTWQGTEAEAFGGSFGRWQGNFQYGREDGDFALYAAGQALHETGWRDFSPSRLGQVFASLGWRHGDASLHLDIVADDTSLTGDGTVPVQLLAVDRAAIFTWPDRQQNRYGQANLYGGVAISPALSLQGNVYVSHLRQRTANGDASDAQPCANTPFLCLDDGSIVTDTAGKPILNFLHGGAYAQLNLTGTDTTAFGGALQLFAKGRVFGAANSLLIGGAYDGGRSEFGAQSEVGAMSPSRGFEGPGVVIDQSDGSIAPVRVSGANDYAGLYAADILKPLPRLTLSLSGRFNVSRVALTDRLGIALNGTHSYERFNPAAGVTYDLTPSLNLYAGYAEANRAPTPAEFSCADPDAPCSLTNFFVADPPLKQVVAKTWEGGFRGSGELFDGALSWHAGVFRADADDDILFAASAIQGRAFFENIGTTRRQGAELGADYARGPWLAGLSYSHTDATFRNPVTLQSPDNPKAVNGLIDVKPGDELPGIPADMAKASVGYRGDGGWSVTADARYAGGQVLRGDEANLDPKTAPYVVADVAGRYPLAERITLTAAVDNLFDAKYETFGSFSPIADVPVAQVRNLDNPRSVSPGAPLSFYLGLSVGL